MNDQVLLDALYEYLHSIGYSLKDITHFRINYRKFIFNDEMTLWLQANRTFITGYGDCDEISSKVFLAFLLHDGGVIGCDFTRCGYDASEESVSFRLLPQHNVGEPLSEILRGYDNPFTTENVIRTSRTGVRYVSLPDVYVDVKNYRHCIPDPDYIKQVVGPAVARAVTPVGKIMNENDEEIDHYTEVQYFEIVKVIEELD